MHAALHDMNVNICFTANANISQHHVGRSLNNTE